MKKLLITSAILFSLVACGNDAKNDTKIDEVTQSLPKECQEFVTLIDAIATHPKAQGQAVMPTSEELNNMKNQLAEQAKKDPKGAALACEQITKQLQPGLDQLNKM